LPIAPKNPPKSVIVSRYDGDKIMDISWDAIVPDHTNGEGDIISYEIEYRNKNISKATTLEQVPNSPVNIEGLYPEGVYEVHVRCVVMIQSIPLPTEYEMGPWSEWVESKGFSTSTGK